MGTNDIHVKICDFGLAKYHATTFLGSMVGTKEYLAPVSAEPGCMYLPDKRLNGNAAGDRDQ